MVCGQSLAGMARYICMKPPQCGPKSGMRREDSLGHRQMVSICILAWNFVNVSTNVRSGSVCPYDTYKEHSPHTRFSLDSLVCGISR